MSRFTIVFFFLNPILFLFFAINSTAELVKKPGLHQDNDLHPPTLFLLSSPPSLSFHWPNCLFGFQLCWKCNQTVSSFVTGMDFSEMGVESHGTCPEEKQMCSCFSGCFSCICCLGLELWLSGVSSELQSHRPSNPFR